jgi:Na+/melibiose symporter-like transporter
MMSTTVPRGPLRLLAGERDLRLLLGASLVSLTGDWILGIGLAYHVYVLTGSTLASAVTLLAGFLPQVLLSTVAGVFVDRWDRKRTMVAANLLLAAGLVPLTLVHRPDQVWIVYTVLVWESVVELFFAPAEQAMLPRVVPDEDLVTANALNGQNQQVARLVGSALGGVAAAAGGITAVAVLDAVTFLVAAALVTLVRAGGRAGHGAPAPADVLRGRLGRLHDEWRDGLRTAWSQPMLRLILVFALITSTGEGVMGTLFAPFVRDVLHGGGQVYGIVTGVQAIGGIAGGLVAAAVGHRYSPIAMLGFGAVLFGLVDLAIFLYPLVLVSAWPAAVGMVLVGLPGAVTMAGFMTLFQRHTTDSHRGRVFGILSLVRAVAMVVGTTAAGLLGGSLGIVPVLAYQGVGYVAAGCMVLAAAVATRASTKVAAH